MNDRQSFDDVAIFSIERPAPVLMTYYVLVSLLLGPLFFVPLVPLFFRYHTLRYRFDAQGISMRWGIQRGAARYAGHRSIGGLCLVVLKPAHTRPGDGVVGLP